MKILNLDIKDSCGLLQVVVEDAVDEERLRKFVTEGMAAIAEKNEAEIQGGE